MIHRDPTDRRGVTQVALDMLHDLHHKIACKTEPDHPDAQMDWRHTGECEFTRANGER